MVLQVVQIKFLAMRITNQKFSFYIFRALHLQNIFMEHEIFQSCDFKMIHLSHPKMKEESILPQKY